MSGSLVVNTTDVSVAVVIDFYFDRNEIEVVRELKVLDKIYCKELRENLAH